MRLSQGSGRALSFHLHHRYILLESLISTVDHS